jgi:hypothetical protein
MNSRETVAVAMLVSVAWSVEGTPNAMNRVWEPRPG